MIPFIITIDAEDDNVWSRPRTPTTRNAACISGFQTLCESYGLKVSYLTTYSMARAEPFVATVADAVRRGTAEVGLHPHAWDTPPLEPLTEDDSKHLPYLVNYSDEIMRQKIAFLTRFLEDTFETPIVSHRAGRWAFNGRYARILASQGFEVDCSVTPHVSWRRHAGDPQGERGMDFTAASEAPYFLDFDDVTRAGSSSLLEVPVTIVARRPAWMERLVLKSGALPRAVGSVMNRLRPVNWLRPNGLNTEALVAIVETAVSSGTSHLEFMLHSSELMPGGSPVFPDRPAIDSLYSILGELFALASRHCRGMTLSEFRTLHLTRMSEGSTDSLRTRQPSPYSQVST